MVALEARRVHGDLLNRRTRGGPARLLDRGLPVIEDDTSAVLRSQVAQQLRGFGAAAQGLENDAIIDATALERGISLIS